MVLFICTSSVIGSIFGDWYVHKSGNMSRRSSQSRRWVKVVGVLMKYTRAHVKQGDYRGDVKTRLITGINTDKSEKVHPAYHEEELTGRRTTLFLMCRPDHLTVVPP